MNSVLTTFLLIYSLLLPTRAMALEQFSYEEGYENCVDYYIRVKFNNSYEAWQRSQRGLGRESRAGSCPVQVTKANKIWTKLSKAEAWPPPLTGSKKARSIQPLWPPNHRLNPSQSSLTIMACGNERGDVIWFTLCHLKSSCVASAPEVSTASSLFSSSSGMPRWRYAWAFDGLRWTKAASVDKTPG